VVIGGGPIGCEVALHLAKSGCPVAIVELLPKIGNRLESMTRKIFLQKLAENNVRIYTDTRLVRVEERGVIIARGEGPESFLEAESVVITTGNQPQNHLFDQIKSLGYEIHQIGDCLEARSAKAAIYEGAVLGRAI
jgi:NADPH-dependent 2,4-dienoyl-CoA reductase/sulfur reductase-like enzyme